jgi:hypothetical protein
MAKIESEYVVSFDPAPINMGHCTVNVNTLLIYDWNKFSIKDSTNEGSCKKLVKQLDDLKPTDDIDCIIIHEQQPRCNMKTITISGQLQMYFVLERMNEDHEGNIEKIVGHHAKHKINYYQPMPGDEPMPWERLDGLKKGHYRTKQILIEHCRRILKQNGDLEWLTWFEQQPKKDDLADSFVQALSYIKMNRLGYYKDLKKV